MKKVTIYSLLLIVGLVGSQLLPLLSGASFGAWSDLISILTLIALAFIMIHVGYEFDIDRSNVRPYVADYLIAMTAAAFPWLFAALYFIFVMMPSLAGDGRAWIEVLLAARFAAPTSAGVLFSMLAAAGLSATWVFRKARILAIFDDLDTVLLMIPLTMLIVGPAWQLGLIVVVMAVLLWAAWRFLHQLAIPVTWPWVLGYGVLIVAVTEVIYFVTKQIDSQVPIHIEVLLPAFVLGCMLKRPLGTDPHRDDAREGHQEGPENATEQRVSTVISGVFIFLVGLSMPAIFGGAPAVKAAATTLTAQQPMPGWEWIALHVLAITVLSNLGKMLPAFMYRAEAHWRERLAVAVGMWPRGEVGAGILIISLGYGIGGPIVTVAALSLALNLLLTGAYIWIVKQLILPLGLGAMRNDGSATGIA